jgi:hypothetical protein
MIYSDDVLRLNPELTQAPTVSPSKYHNAHTDAAGMTFQSGKEAAGVAGLIMLEQQGIIFALRFQVRFGLPGGIVYVADAVYCEPIDGVLQVVVKDFKGFETKEFKLKRKLFESTYRIKLSLE